MTQAMSVDPASTRVTVRRFVQYVIDYVVFAVLVWAVVQLAHLLDPGGGWPLDVPRGDAGRWPAPLGEGGWFPAAFGSAPRFGGALTVVVVWLVVFAALPAWRDRTAGMSLLGLRVERVHGGRATFGQHLVRAVLLPLDLIGFVIPGLVVMLFSRRRQRIGDHVAGTVVTRSWNGLRNPGSRGWAAG